MKQKEWALKYLKEYDFDVTRLLNDYYYEKYIEETESEAFFSSYKRYLYYVRKEYNEQLQNLEQNEKFESVEDLNIEEDADKLISLLEEATAQRGRKLKFSDLSYVAAKNNFSPSSFQMMIPNLNETLSDIYKVNSLDLKSDVDSIKLKRKISVLEQEVNNLKNQHADYSILVDTLNEVVEIYEPWKSPVFIKSKSNNIREVVALYSDLHAGEIVSLEETHGINEYNQHIMKRRIDSFFNQIVEYADEVGSSVINFKMLGDLINGEIHEELMINSDLDTIESLILVADYTSQWIRNLSKHFSEIKILGVSGNHGRFHKKPSFKKRNILNFDYLAYEFMKRELKNVVKEFYVPKSPFSIHEILGFRFFSTHGEMFKGGTGLSPQSGTWGRDIEKLNGVYKSTGGFQYAEFAHFHTPILETLSFSGISIITNGSIKGGDEFSLGAVKSSSRPAQIVYTVEENYGTKFLTKLFLD